MFFPEGHQGQAHAFGAVDDPARDPTQGAPFAGDQQATAADRPSRGRPPAWLIIVLVLGLVAVVSPWALPHGVEIAAVSIVTLLLVLVLVRPQWALFVFILALPLHNLMMALLFHLTGSVPFVKLIQPWKEIVLGLALLRALVPMASRWLRRQPEASPWLRVTPLDIVAALLIVISAISVILPNHLVPLVGRLYGFRDLNMPLVAFAVGRLAPLSRRELKTLVALVAVDVVAFAVGAVGERALWGNGLLLAVDYGTYIHRFLGQTSPLPHNTPWTFYAAGYFPRAGSLAVGPLDVSILVLIALPLLIVAGGRGSEIARRWSAALGLAALLGGTALVLAFGRESLLLVVLECALLIVFMRPRWQWKGVALTLAGGVLGGALLLAVAWFVVQAPNDDARFRVANTGLVSLLANTSTSGGRKGDLSQLLHQSTSANNPSTVGHLQSLLTLARAIAHHPQGYGIGTSGQVGSRFGTGTSGGETSYLSIGVELGVVGLLLYLAAFVSAVFVCWRAAYSRLSLLHRGIFLGVGIAWLAIALDGIFAEVTLNTFAMYFLWWMSGFAVTAVQQSRVEAVSNGPGNGVRWVAARPLRVAVDAQCLQTARTGVRTYVDELFRRFARPDSPDQIVLLHGPKRLPSSVRLFRIINQAMYLPWLHVWLPVRLGLGNFDALFSPEYLTPAWTPVPRIVTFYDASFLRRPQDYNRLWLAMFRRISLPALRRADAVIVPSRYTASETTQLARVPADRMHVVALGAPARHQRAQISEQAVAQTLAAYGLVSGRYVLHVGVLERRKNLVTLVRAFALWREQGAPADYKLALVGQPGPRPDLDDSPNIRQAVAELGLEGQVILTGHVPLADRDTLYAHAAVVAVPSVFEGFGLPLLEAFAAGAPVVAARATSLPEVGGDAALFFDPTSPQDLTACLMRVTSNPALRAALVRAGDERALNYTWERTASATLEVFDAAVLRRYQGSSGMQPQGGLG